MQLFVYLLAYPFLLLISKLPFRLLYILSDVVYFIVYYVFGYRKKVVNGNLKLAFPDLSEKEIKVIEKKSYKHLCDMFLEMIKTISITNQEIEKRFVFKNLEKYLELEKKGKSIALMCAHYASYEWVLSMNNYISFKGYGIYKRINNKYFDKMVRRIRSRFKAELLTTRQTKFSIEENSKSGVLGLYGFASDQSPQVRANTYWSTFLNIETPVHVGAEILAKRYDMNVVFLEVKKIKRGYYEATLELLSDQVSTVPNFQITETFLKKVEKLVREAPEYYLWTHKRWKHTKKK